MVSATFEHAITEIGSFAKAATSPFGLFNYLRKAMKESPVKAVVASVALGILIVYRVQKYLEAKQEKERIVPGGSATPGRRGSA